MDKSMPFMLNPREGKEIKVGNSTIFLKLSSDRTDDKFSITEYEILPGFPGPPAHKHKVFEHSWYVLEGELTVNLNYAETIITKGGFIYISKKSIHAFSNKSSSIVRLLVIDAPGGFEKYYEDLQAAFGDGEALDPEVFRKIQLNYDTYPPDYLFD